VVNVRVGLSFHYIFNIFTYYIFSKEGGSWKAYYIKGTIDEWEAEDQLFRKPLEKIILFVQKMVFLVWKFLPWVLLCLPSWHYESLYYLFYFLLCVILSRFIDRRYGDQHEYFTFMKISMVLIIIPLATVLYNADMTLRQLLISMCLYIIVLYALITEIYLGLFNNVVVKQLRPLETYQAFPSRIRIPGSFFALQKIWPFAALTIMTCANIVTVWLCSTLTSLLYNGAVADKWNRAHLLIKQQRQYDPFTPPQSGKAEAGPSTAIDVKGSSSNSTDLGKLDGISVEVMDHIEQMQKKMTMMQEQMRRNMELMVKSKNLTQASFINHDEPTMSYADIKREISQKTQMLMEENVPEKKKEAINIDLERLFIMLENTQEYKDEKHTVAHEKREKDEPIDRRCLETMRARYSEQNQNFNPAVAERFRTLPTLRLIIMDTVEIVKKHAEEWQLMTLNGLVLEELKAIRANLPQFSRSQTRQLAWCKNLDDAIDKLETSPQQMTKKPRPMTKKITFANTVGSAITAKSFLLEQIKTRSPR